MITQKKKWVFVGVNCIVEMLKQLHKLSKQIMHEMKHNDRIHMTEHDNKNFNEATTCYLCDESFEKEG